MPCMPRQNHKATKIAFKILGIPAPLKFKRSKAQEDLNKRLLAQETSRIK
jgi:hypothetical protein